MIVKYTLLLVSTLTLLPFCIAMSLNSNETDTKTSVVDVVTKNIHNDFKKDNNVAQTYKNN